ncbi:MAG: LemA family protein [Bacillota bacterium]|uniref:LemA family protein n=1 Tax=unclassified Carboxydocella TaxID=2685367 RepID=UPI0009AF06BE|nr:MULTISPECIES: LemA family protein [unclassified Carboxydocella]AVX30824.1 LemA protein [Carboxydocella thermautotrophica]GAW28087.1 LemA family protein [Carboxydocella sp. ULO1]GAW32464.1 LemA family protein [Carboxydocella sp. JDF658]
MKKAWIPVLVILGIVLVLGMSLSSTYNNLVTMEQQVESSWAQVQNQLQRRADLIPNLVETVKGYAAHEKEVLGNIAEARSRLAGARTPAEAATANAQLDSALSRLLVVVENYPNLKADANFRQLMDELAGTENRIAVARQDYNKAVQAYNTYLKSFPTNLVAGVFGFNAKEFFQAQPGAEQAPKVDFGSGKS